MVAKWKRRLEIGNSNVGGKLLCITIISVFAFILGMCIIGQAKPSHDICRKPGAYILEITEEDHARFDTL